MWQRHRKTDASQTILRCSFCGKSQNEVRKLIAGPTVFICDECVAICNEIITDEHRASATTPVSDDSMAPAVADASVSGPAIQCALCRLPIIVSDGLPIPNRGVLCLGCIGEIEATIAERREAGS